MGYFDFMIDKGAKPEDKEYLYLLDTYWKPEGLESFPIEWGSIVTDVEQQESGRYLFTIKETGVRASSTYAWAFAEHTYENAKHIDAYVIDKAKLEKAKADNAACWNKIKTLKTEIK